MMMGGRPAFPSITNHFTQRDKKLFTMIKTETEGGERESYSHSCVFHDMGRFHEKYISSKIQENWLFRGQTGFSRVIFLLVCLHAQWSFSSSQIPPLHFNQLDIHIFLLKHHTFQTQNLPVWYRLCFLPPPLLNYYNIGWFQTRSAEIWPG